MNTNRFLLGLVIVSSLLLMYITYRNDKLNKELKNIKEITLIHNTQVIDTLRKENLILIKDLTKINEKLLEYKMALAKVRKLNAELIARTKTVYIPELKNNRTSREILSDLEQHRKYMFISDSLNN